MKTYTVKIFKAGQHVDTQTVTETTPERAKTMAMAQTKVRMMGAKADYEVTEVKVDATNLR